MREMWEVRNMPGHIIGIISSQTADNWLMTANLEEIDPVNGHRKGMEIASWLYDNRKQHSWYVIIDDEYVVLESQVVHFILTNPYDGITEELANRTISILNHGVDVS